MSDKTADTVFISKVAKISTFASALFVALISLLLIMNFVQLQMNNPLDSPALAKLIAKLGANKNDEELKAQIRDFDLVARKAFFTKQWQIRFGGILLFAGAAIFVASLRLSGYLGKGGERRTRNAGEQPAQLLESNKRIATIVLLVFFFATTAIIGYASYVMLGDESIGRRLESSAEKQAAATSNNEATDEELSLSWPSFRGPNYGGGVDDPAGVFAEKNIPKLAVLWKAKTPKNGFSSPIVWRERLFFTGADDKNIEMYAFDAKSGNIVWSKNLEEILGNKPAIIGKKVDSGYAAPTMTTNGSRIFAMFASGDLAALAVDGALIWKRSFGVPENTYGHASSLASRGHTLVVQFDNYTESKIFMLDTDTGKTVREIKRDMLASWSSPVIVNAGTRTEIIANGNPFVTAYDFASGVELWSTECLGSDLATSPTFADGLVFVASQYARLAAIDNATGAILWENGDDLPSVASPAANASYVITATDYGIVTCRDAKKGSLVWSHEYSNGFYSSPVICGGTLILTDLAGTLHFVKLGDTFVEAGTIQLKERIVCTPAIEGGRLYARSESNLYCIGLNN